MLTGIEPSGAYVKLTWCPPCFGADRDPTFSATCPVTAPTVPSSGDQPANPCTGGESVYGRRTGGKPVYGRQICVREANPCTGPSKAGWEGQKACVRRGAPLQRLGSRVSMTMTMEARGPLGHRGQGWGWGVGRGKCTGMGTEAPPGARRAARTRRQGPWQSRANRGT